MRTVVSGSAEQPLICNPQTNVMKTILPGRFFLPALFAFCFAFCSIAKAQTYTTVANGLWNLPTTWKNGSMPPAANIPAAAVINIKHIVTYIGGSINNSGTINITNGGSVSARLMLPGGINITNKSTGKIYITNGELRQYRYVGGLELGLPQSGTFKNDGGTFHAINSFVEVAQDWSNESNGTVNFRNSVLLIGRNYSIKDNAKDTIEYTSVSLGLHGTGDYIADGYGSYYQNARFEVASTNGRFELKEGKCNGVIDHIVLKNHLTNIYSSDKIKASSNVITTGGLLLRSYCIGNGSNYEPNGKISGPQLRECSKYFPAGLMGSTETASFNFSNEPSLITGSDLRVGATYKYESVTPGVDAIVTIDSLVGGATITKLDDNTGGLGYIEGFQPEIKVGRNSGRSYAVFTIQYKISGTSENHLMNTFSLTALDIDGNNTLKEFDEIDLGPGAVASYQVSSKNIAFSQIAPGVFRATNADEVEYDGIDTVKKQNMFTVTNSNISSFTLKLGVTKTNSSQPSRQFGIYMKGFVYPELATLPVKMEYFTAIPNMDFTKAELRWATSVEKNTNYFSIEKSLDGKNFTQAGLVFAAGNSAETIKYSFNDDLANTGNAQVVYYRIRSVDNDGSSELSIVRSIRIGKKIEQVSILAYPNPVATELRVTIPSGWQGRKVIYELYNTSGQALVHRQSTMSSQTETIDVSGLKIGNYIIKVSCGDESSSQKVIRR